MKLATWNINGIKARAERVTAWLAATEPTALGMQEIKSVESGFPREPFEALGYRAAVLGQKGYNGVAIVARGRLDEIELGLGDGDDDPQARLAAATLDDGVRFVCLYAPNGGALGSDAYAYKLRWFERLARYLERALARHPLLCVCGDYNVAPGDRDVYDPEAFRGQVLCSDEERAAYGRLVGLGLVDLYRQLHPDGVAYTWWDYRMLGFPKNHGLRIDHALGSPALAARCRAVAVDRNARKGKSPSDHAPLVVELAAG
ncbi:MAG: exodeoxyribonuclease III [Polyangiaceae bacterium]|nr:exodeoxyribonuclease III [Polyangiaceae bacterium]